MTRGIALLVLCVVIALSILLLYLNRHRSAFKNIFGLLPKKANQEIVDEEMTALKKALASYEKKGVFVSELDKDCERFLQQRIEQAAKLAKKYGFQVPLEQK